MKKMSKVDLALSISRVLSNYQEGRRVGKVPVRGTRTLISMRSMKRIFYSIIMF